MHYSLLLDLLERNYFGSLHAVSYIINSFNEIISGFHVHFTNGIRNLQRIIKDFSKNINVNDE